MKKGLIIIYIGDGKGKTSAAVGLAVRAAGSGIKVAYTQFAKGEWPSAENEVLRKIKNVEVNIFGKGFVKILGDKKPFSVHKKEALRAYGFAKKQIKSRKYDLVVLDEVISAAEQKLLTVKQVVDLIKAKPAAMHLCMTGHDKFHSLLKRADLVTEMKMIKHPYYKGILAQKGIDY